MMMGNFKTGAFIAAGRAGRNAEYRTTQTGKEIVKFSLSTNWGKDVDPGWVNCTVWGGMDSPLYDDATSVQAGDHVYVMGRASTNAYIDSKTLQKKQSLECNVDWLGVKHKRAGATAASPSTAGTPPLPWTEVDEDELPF